MAPDGEEQDAYILGVDEKVGHIENELPVRERGILIKKI